MKVRRLKLMSLLCVSVLVFIYYFFGVGDYIIAKSFDKEFDYPLNIDVRLVVDDILSGRKAKVAPINVYPFRFITNSGKCRTLEKLDLFIVVKSAMNNFGRRLAIRQTYGQENFMPGRIIRILFFLGIESQRSELQKRVDEEILSFKDIIQADFYDTYFNNTIKTMTSLRWLFENCPAADFYLFTDDDMYISVDNLLNFVNDKTSKDLSNIGYKEQLYAGYMFKSAPHRHQISKWKVSIEEYPWDRWPAYVTGGAYVMSNKSMKYMYLGSLFVKHFRFDDIFLGIVAKKVGIQPSHCASFFFYKKPYDPEGYKNVIASHGFGDPQELVKVWNQMNLV